MKVVYFAHNLNDPAVQRRVRFLQLGGSDELVLLGFRRSEQPVEEVTGVRPIDLGRTFDFGHAQRVWAVLRALAQIGKYKGAIEGASVIIARNIECLQIASIARHRFAPDSNLVYECLDLHKLVLHPLWGYALRAVEGRLLRKCSFVIVSSPAYVANYFSHYYKQRPKILVVENKILFDEVGTRAEAPIPPSRRPWHIGWFGNLRCQESLHLLKDLVESLPGAIEVSIRGTPNRLAIPDFDEVVRSTPGLHYYGPYDRSKDLDRMYSRVHFNWVIERFERGGNGNWQLTNRLYEGGLFKAVAIAERNVELGRWLAQRRTGVLVEEPLAANLRKFFSALSEAQYQRLRSSAEAVPTEEFVCTLQDCERCLNLLAH